MYSANAAKAIENALAKQFGGVEKLVEPSEWKDVDYLDEIQGGAGN